MRPPRRDDPRRPACAPAGLAALAVLAAALAPPARAGPAPERPEALAPASGGALRISADPPLLLLGKDGASELHVAAPAEVQELTLTTTAGRIEGLRRLPAGGFAARYRPPAERHPQIAIVAAAAVGAAGPLDGWLALPLHGQGEAKVRAAPGTSVALRVGERTFAARAGRDGVAVIPVVVPPGVREAHQGFKPIDLRIPDTTLLHASLDRTVVAADRPERVRVIAYVVAPHGAARRGDDPVFEPSRGNVSVRPREPGAFEATWTLPPGQAGPERLTVRLPGSAPSRRVLELATVPGPPVTVAIAFDRDALVAGEADAVLVTARAVDAAGNAVAAPLEIEADGGTVEGLARRTPEVQEARVVVGARFGGRRALLVTARAPDSGLSAARVLPLRAAPPARARLERAEAVVADGRREVRLRLAVLDRFENATGLSPRVTAARGRVAGVEPDGPGGHAVRYVGPRVDGHEEDVLSVEVPGLSAQARVGLVPPRGPLGVAVAAGGLSDVRRRFAGGRLGLALDLDLERLGLEALRSVGGFAIGARLEGDLAFSSGDDLRWEAGPGQSGPRAIEGRFSARAWTLLAGLSAARELHSGPTLLASAAAGLHRQRFDPEGGGPFGETAPAARLAVGVGWRRRAGMPFLEASLLAAGPARAGSFAALAISAGWRFDLEP